MVKYFLFFLFGVMLTFHETIAQIRRIGIRPKWYSDGIEDESIREKALWNSNLNDGWFDKREIENDSEHFSSINNVNIKKAHIHNLNLIKLINYIRTNKKKGPSLPFQQHYQILHNYENDRLGADKRFIEFKRRALGLFS